MAKSELTKAEALAALAIRKKHQPKRIDNTSLYAGSPMYFYCRVCRHQSDCLPENYLTTPRKLCGACQDLKDAGWLEE
jgi:hypothetical protein